MTKATLFVAGLVCAVSQHALCAQQYEYLDLGNGTVSAINNAGQAVGSIYNAKGVLQAVLWNQGTATYLSSLGGTSEAAAVNGIGQVAGRSWNNGPQAVVWSNGAITTLASSASYADSGAVGINDSGVVVGNASQYGPNPQAVVWSGFNITPLSNAGGTSSVATGINNSGLVSGYVNGYPGTNNPQAVTWQGNTATLLANLAPTNAYSAAYAVNNGGIVVGSANDSNSNMHAVAWSNGVLSVLDSLSSADEALGINDLGIAVGKINYGSGAAHAALWDTKNGHGIDLNALLAPNVLPSGITLVAAYGINDAGDIVGTSFNKATGYFGAFELLAVPEPSTVAMWSIGLAALCVRQRRKRTS